MKVTKDQIMNRLSELVDQYIDQANEAEDDSTLDNLEVKERTEDFILWTVHQDPDLIDAVNLY